MLEKLLDEPYWPKMEEEITLFFEGKEDQGVYCGKGGPVKGVDLFLSHLMKDKINKLELQYLGQETYRFIRTYSTGFFIPKDQIANHLDFNDVKKNIIHRLEALKGTLYVYSVNIPGKIALEFDLTHLRDADPLYWNAHDKIRGTMSIDESIKVLEEFVTYKIKNSGPYKDLAK